MSRLEFLKSSDMHLWCCPLAQLVSDQRDRYFDLLDDGERTRFARFISEEARTQFLVGRALLRSCLSRYAPVEPRAWQFEFNAFGKPRIAHSHGFDWLSFNVSHSRGMVICGICRDGELGVDVENRRQLCELSLADRFFTPHEAGIVRSAPEALRHQTFLTIWTLKEAVIKACGEGLSIPLSDFDVQLEPDEPRVQFTSGRNDDARQWQLFRLTLESDFHSAIAVRRSGGVRLQLLQRSAWSEALL